MCHTVVEWDESFKELLKRVIEEHKETLDKLSGGDNEGLGDIK